MLDQMELDPRVVDREKYTLTESIMFNLERRMLYAYDYAPPILACMGAHIADLHQADPVAIETFDGHAHGIPFYYVMGQPEHLGIGGLIITASGAGKSHLLKLFFTRRTGIFPFASKFSGTITEAGLVGSTKAGDDPTAEKGDAWNFREGVLVFHEFSSVLTMAEQKHSSTLIDRIMEILSERHCTKRLKGVTIEYDTYCTIMGGTQWTRFNVSQGLGRRFIFSAPEYNEDFIREMREVRWKYMVDKEEVRTANLEEIKHIRNIILDVHKENSIESVRFTPDMYTYINHATEEGSHLDNIRLEKGLIGYAYMNNTNMEATELLVTKSQENCKLVDLIMQTVDRVSRGGNYAMLVMVINAAGGRIHMRDLWMTFKKASYAWPDMFDILRDAERKRIIRVKSNIVTLLLGTSPKDIEPAIPPEPDMLDDDDIRKAREDT